MSESPNSEPSFGNRRQGIGWALRRAEKKILVAYVRYARAHRDSNRLPVALFALLFLDAFVMLIPSMLITAAAVTITPRRWKLFSLIFVIAVTANNFVTYLLGKHLPHALILNAVEKLNITTLWEGALEAILQYGKYATFMGGFLPMPTQLVTMMIGMAENQTTTIALRDAPAIEIALLYGALGHGIKIFIFCSVIRFGWIKLEKKVAARSDMQ